MLGCPIIFLSSSTLFPATLPEVSQSSVPVSNRNVRPTSKQTAIAVVALRRRCCSDAWKSTCLTCPSISISDHLISDSSHLYRVYRGFPDRYRALHLSFEMILRFL
jgi:hypothetical protein